MITLTVIVFSLLFAKGRIFKKYFSSLNIFK
jgi:hypothetical protein